MKPHEQVLTLLLALSLATMTAYVRDGDNNPSGPKGGVGTNWENPPRSRESAGVSPYPRHLLHYHLLKAFDADNDGTLSVSERHALYQATESCRRDVISTFDANRDGGLSRPERDALSEAAKMHFLERFDRNGDGRLNDSESEAAEAARADATREPASSGNDCNIGRKPDARDRRKAGNNGNMGNIGKPEQVSPRKGDSGGGGGSRGGSNGDNRPVTHVGRR